MYQQTFPFAFPDPLSQRPMPPATASTPMAARKSPSRRRRAAGGRNPEASGKLKARISVNEVRQLEFGTYGSQQEIIGSATIILEDLHDWFHGRAFRERGLEYLNRGKSYLHDIHQSDASGTVLCLWHETPLVDGKQLMADESDGSVTATEVQEGMIPGIPAYYWFPPGSSYQCNVRLPDRPASRGSLVNFLRAFMTEHCTLVNHARQTDNETGEVVHCKLPDGRPVRAVIDIVTATRKDLGDLRNQLAAVRAIERKDFVQHRTHGVPSLLQRIFGYEDDDVPNTTTVHHKFDVPDGISKAFFEQLVEFYQERGGDEFDIGFYKARQEVQWLSSRRLISTQFLDVEEADGVVRDLEQLADALQARNGKILGGTA